VPADNLDFVRHPEHLRLIAAELEGARGQWFLEVRESNIAALNLYKACGFQEAGRRNSYYHDPTESGIVMKLNS